MEFTVQLSGAKSRVIIEKGCHRHIADYTAFSGKVAVISDDNIPYSLKETVLSQLDNATLIEVPQGEKAKSIEVYTMVQSRLLELGFSRKDWVAVLWETLQALSPQHTNAAADWFPFPQPPFRRLILPSVEKLP